MTHNSAILGDWDDEIAIRQKFVLICADWLPESKVSCASACCSERLAPSPDASLFILIMKLVCVNLQPN